MNRIATRTLSTNRVSDARQRRLINVLVGSLAWVILLGASAANAASHSWDITEIFSNADGTIQFVELQEQFGSPTELGMPNQFIQSDAHIFRIGGSAPFPTANKFYLIATAAFAALPGAPTPDVIIDPGFLPFVNIAGDSIYYVPYDTVTFTSGQLPTDGVNSLFRDLTTGVNSPTNYAGETGSVGGPPPPFAPALGLVGSAVMVALMLGGGFLVLRGGGMGGTQA